MATVTWTGDDQYLRQIATDVKGFMSHRPLFVKIFTRRSLFVNIFIHRPLFVDIFTRRPLFVNIFTRRCSKLCNSLKPGYK